MLTKRLEIILESVSPTDCVWDMGCDHGYLAVALVTSGKAKRVIASDISGPSLEKAKTLIEKSHLTDKVSCRLGDGFDVISPGEVNTAVMAGIGGHLIAEKIDALSTIDYRIEAFVLQPMNRADLVRHALEAGGYAIISERVVREDNHFYQIIKAIRGKMRIDNPLDYTIGFSPARHADEDFEAFILSLIDKEKEILQNVNQHTTDGAVARRVRSERTIEQLTEVIGHACQS